MKEVWKDIKGYEELYQISNYGNIISKRIWTGRMFIHKEKKLKPTIAKNGYLRITLSKGNKCKYVNIHRLVAEAFIPNPNKYPCINHKDGNKLNNNIYNLEWCTQKHNIQEAFKTGLIKIPKGKYNHRAKQVIQKDLNNKVIRTWDYMAKITEELGFGYTNISKCCTGKLKTAYGYKWEYKEGYNVNT